jgi:hypothetical protein
MAEKGRRSMGKTGNYLNISDPKVYEAIRKRAYELYCKRGHTDGNDMQDWLKAEREVRREMGMAR